jgi:hypothetical protein
MLKTKAVVSNISEIPREWVFEFYLKLDTQLTGQDVQLHSAFNPEDKTPSMFVYFDKIKRRYLYKCFSTDNQGDGTDLVMRMFGLTTRGEAAHKIIEDYNNFVTSNPEAYFERVFTLHEKYKVVDHKTRKWTKDDQNYWTAFKIGSDLLGEYNVKPLSQYTLFKEERGIKKELIIKGLFIYGYFDNAGILYKIYQPKNKHNKFVRIHAHIHGDEQLKYNVPYLVICSSLKDMMAFRKLRFTNAEQIAPESENVLIPKDRIEYYKMKYKAICTLFDNDEAGMRSKLKYETEFQIPGVILNIEQDVAKAVKEHGINNTRIVLQPILSKTLNSYIHDAGTDKN